MERPYPELYNDDPNKAILRDFPNYYADALKGCIYIIKTGKIRKHGRKGHIGLAHDGKTVNTYAQIQILTAFMPKPSPTHTVDHIDNRRPDCHLLSNLRWATKSEQRANQTRPFRHVGKERPIIVTDANGEATVYSTSNEWLKAMGRSTKLGSNQQDIRIAIRKGTGVFGATKVEWWLPSDTGEFAPIQPAFINGAVGYSVSQFGGWVKLPTGRLSQGHKRYDGRRKIGIGTNVYLVYRLVASAHLAPADDPTKTMVNHIDGNPSNSNYRNLEWVTAGENIRHAQATGLCKNRRPVHMYSLTWTKIWTFPSVTEAVEFVRRRNKKASDSRIVGCCRENRGCKTAYNYRWTYADTDSAAENHSGESD
ncbi:hypothetical protein JKP88DRAFT_243893 [Tribonema minus]|uniref:HNH nuclease domain-containing protein n=1 Tax=Tribonema minus TaxID=303371 RepID=A0A835Z5J3_9STRA|nr:hypothetical protein JKP88DRAFT_243893 [Tribonema minus]